MLSYREGIAYLLWGIAPITVIYGAVRSFELFRVCLLIALILTVIGGMVYFSAKLRELNSRLDAGRIGDELLREFDHRGGR